MVTVLLREGEIPTLNMNISITDDRGLDYLLVNIEGIEGYENLKIDADGEKAFEHSFNITMPNEKKDYPMCRISKRCIWQT